MADDERPRMTPPAKPLPASGGDPADPRGREAEPDRDGPASLVWPPPDDELESLEVISLGPPTAPASAAPPPRLEIAVPAPRPSTEPPAPLPRVEVTPPADTDRHAGRRDARELRLSLDDGGARVPLWMTVLLMLAAGGAGFAAAWYLR